MSRSISGSSLMLSPLASILCLPLCIVKQTPFDPCMAARYNAGVKNVPEEVRRYVRAWGRKGGKTRAARLTPEQRRRIARRAARARWNKSRREKPQG